MSIDRDHLAELAAMKGFYQQGRQWTRGSHWIEGHIVEYKGKAYRSRWAGFGYTPPDQTYRWELIE